MGLFHRLAGLGAALGLLLPGAGARAGAAAAAAEVREERLLERELGRIRDVREGPDGYVYVLTDHADGVLARLEPLP